MLLYKKIDCFIYYIFVTSLCDQSFTFSLTHVHVVLPVSSNFTLATSVVREFQESQVSLEVYFNKSRSKHNIVTKQNKVDFVNLQLSNLLHVSFLWYVLCLMLIYLCLVSVSALLGWLSPISFLQALHLPLRVPRNLQQRTHQRILTSRISCKQFKVSNIELFLWAC